MIIRYAQITTPFRSNLARKQGGCFDYGYAFARNDGATLPASTFDLGMRAIGTKEGAYYSPPHGLTRQTEMRECVFEGMRGSRVYSGVHDCHG